MTNFRIRRSWLARSRSRSELDATFCKLEIIVGNRTATEFVSADEVKETSLEIPAYYLAEWIAENWWAILWEPRKDDEQIDNQDFLLRHSMVAAEHGFPLPAILIVPLGEYIQLSVSPREAQYAQVQFSQRASVVLGRADIERELRRFIEGCISRLQEWEIGETPLSHAWSLVRQTTQDEALFCRLMGALGLSPYDTHEVVEEKIDRLLEELGERITFDLCLASTGENFLQAARAAELTHDLIGKSQPADIQPLAAVQLPPDDVQLQSWVRGVTAARRVRSKFGIRDTDPGGGDSVLDRLKIDVARRDEMDAVHEIVPLVGAVDRQEYSLRIGLLQEAEPSRRFAAARGTYLAWTSDPVSRRLVTNAMTRHQQASRAFAAELLAPIRYIQSQIKGGKLPQYQVHDIAHVLRVGPDVVYKQALNNGIQVTPI